jgi:hypothetical protein
MMAPADERSHHHHRGCGRQRSAAGQGPHGSMHGGRTCSTAYSCTYQYRHLTTYSGRQQISVNQSSPIVVMNTTWRWYSLCAHGWDDHGASSCRERTRSPRRPAGTGMVPLPPPWLCPFPPPRASLPPPPGAPCASAAAAPLSADEDEPEVVDQGREPAPPADPGGWSCSSSSSSSSSSR